MFIKHVLPMFVPGVGVPHWELVRQGPPPTRMWTTTIQHGCWPVDNGRGRTLPILQRHASEMHPLLNRYRWSRALTLGPRDRAVTVTRRVSTPSEGFPQRMNTCGPLDVGRVYTENTNSTNSDAILTV